MKRLFLLPLLLTFPVSAQQVTEFDTCTRVRETYVPGYQNPDGSWVNGIVRREKFTVPCGNVQQSAPVVVSQPQPYYYRRRVCNPTAGALLGAGLAGAISGNSWSNGGSWSRTYNRNGSSGSYSNYGRNNYWPLFGAGLGALAFSC
jgi:hypothetical protein